MITGPLRIMDQRLFTQQMERLMAAAKQLLDYPTDERRGKHTRVRVSLGERS
jgi:hypothetical protein